MKDDENDEASKGARAVPGCGPHCSWRARRCSCAEASRSLSRFHTFTACRLVQNAAKLSKLIFPLLESVVMNRFATACMRSVSAMDVLTHRLYCSTQCQFFSSRIRVPSRRRDWARPGWSQQVGISSKPLPTHRFSSVDTQGSAMASSRSGYDVKC